MLIFVFKIRETNTYLSLVGEGQTTHSALDAEDVIVGREHVHGGRVSGVHGHRDLSIVNTGEVTGASWLVLFWLEGERVRVHTWKWVTGVVVEWLDLVEVLTLLLFEAILTVKNKFECRKWTSSFFSEISGGRFRIEEWDTTRLADWDIAVGGRTATWIVFEDNLSRVVGGGEVPEVVTRSRIGEAPDQFLNWVVVGQTDLLGRTGGDGVGASVLHLLNKVFVTLLRESSAFLGVEVHVVRPNLENVLFEVSFHVGGQIDVDADFVVLERNQWQIQTWVAVEEEHKWQVHSLTILGGSHLRPVGFLSFIQVKLGVQTPPLLVVLVNALTTDGEFNVVDRTLGNPVVVGGGVGGNGGVDVGFEFQVHVTDQITVAGNGHGHAA